MRAATNRIARGMCAVTMGTTPRYFLLNLRLKEDRDTSYKTHLAPLLERRTALLSADVSGSTLEKMVLFYCENECIPYDFVKKAPAELKQAVDSFKIEELEIWSQQESKELTRLFTALAR